MKKILFALMLMLLPVMAYGTPIKPAEYVSFMGFDVLDSAGVAHHRPDSVRIMVYRNGSKLTDTWYNAGDAQADSTLPSNTLSFFDQLQDIDGAGGTGQYQIMAWFLEDDSSLYHKTTKWYEVGTKDSIMDIRTEVAGVNGLTPLQATDNIGINWGDVTNQGTSVNLSATTTNLVNTVTTATTATTVTNLAATAVDDIMDADTNTADLASGFGRAIAEGARATTPANKLDISATGEAGVDWNNVGTPTATVALTNTTVGTVTTTTTATNLTTNNDKTGYALTAGERQAIADTNEARLDLTGKTIGTATNLTNNNDKTGYSLTAAERGAIEDSIHANAADYKADVSALATASVQTDIKDTVNAIIDTLNAVIDSLQSQDDWILKPTVAGRTLDVTVNGNAGIDWGNIENATAPSTRPHVDVQAINSNTLDADNLMDTVTAIRDYVDELERAEIHVTGAITGTPGTTGAASTTAFGTEADNYYNNQVVVFVTGTVAGQSTRITDFTNSTDSMTFDALTAPPAVGDSFVIIAQYDAGGGSVTISEADKGDIADSVWKVPFSFAFVTGSMGDSLNNSSYVQGSASGLTAAEIADSVWEELVSGHTTALTYGDTLTKMLEVIRDTSNAVIDTLQNQDNWVAKEASLYDPATDSVIVNFTIWNSKDPEVTVVTNNDKTSYSLTTAERAAIEDSVYANRADYKATGFATSAALTDVTDTVNAVIDTLQSKLDATISSRSTLSTSDNIGINWADVASQTATVNLTNTWVGNVTDLADSAIDAASIKTNSITANKIAANAIGASEFAPDAAAKIEDSVYANRADYKATGFATSAAQTTMRDTINAIHDSVSVTAYDNLEEAFDGDDVGPHMYLDRLRIKPSAGGDDTAVYIYAKRAGSTGKGLFIEADTAVVFRGDNDGADFAGNFDSTDFIATYFNRIYDGVWDEAQSGHTTNGTFGAHLNDTVGKVYKIAVDAIDAGALSQSAADEIWEYDTSNVSGATAFGTMLKDTAAYQGGGGGGGNPAGGWIDSVRYFGDSAFILDSAIVKGGAVDSNRTEQGGISGANRTWTVIAVDSGGGDTVAVPNVSVDVQNTTGTTLLRGTTDALGSVVFTVPDSEWALVAVETGYTFDSIHINVTGNQTDTVWGYDFVVGSPTSADLSRVYGYLRTTTDEKIEGARVIATFHTGENQADSSGTAVIISDILAEATSDSTGYFFIDLRRTTSYADTSRGFYDIRGFYGTKPLFEVLKLYVPNTGNLNLGDTLAVRQ